MSEKEKKAAWDAVGALALLVFVLFLLIAIPARAEWKWELFGADPFAKTRKEAMEKREEAFKRLELPEAVAKQFMVATEEPGVKTHLVNGKKLTIMLSGKKNRKNVIVAFTKPSIRAKVEYAAPSEQWVVTDGEVVFTLFLPEVCYNWSLVVANMEKKEERKAPAQAKAEPAEKGAENPTPKAKPPATVNMTSDGCPNGWRLYAHAWSRAVLPAEIQKNADELIALADERDSKNAANVRSYAPDDVSRTLGARLRKEVKIHAPVAIDLKVIYRDPKNPAIPAKEGGVLKIVNGLGSIQLPDDPRQWVIETIWPEQFLSPTVSGGERRLLLFPDEWKDWCSMNEHGIVP